MDDVISPKLQRLKLNKQSGYNYRERRQEDWLENYTLYRDRVVVNRLTQRQSVNIPIMKTQIKSLLKDVDDMPVLVLENLKNDEQAEVFFNEYWKWTVEKNKLEIKDIVDKKQVMLYGRSFMQLQIVDGCVMLSVEDPQDILVDRYMDPTDLDSSRFLIHTHIFRPLSALKKNPMYDKEAIKRLEQYYASEEGIVKSAQNAQMLVEKNEKMAELGLSDVDSPVLGETIVELTLHFNYDKTKSSDEEELFLTVECDDMQILMDKTLTEIIGKTKDDYWKTHFPYNTWADDVERQDFWSDSIADTIRTPNKVVNAWFSQEVENRTLRNYGMHYYDASKSAEGFTPQTFNPQPWGWYAVPGNPKDVVQKVDIPTLDNNLDAMNFVIGISEKASGASPTQQGAEHENSNITLGEVELVLSEAKERVKGMSKFYTQAWKERGEKFMKLVEAGQDKLDAVEIFKKGRNTDKIYTRTIAPDDWKIESGYTIRVWSQDEKNAKDTKSLQTLQVLKSTMPDNPKVDEIYKRKLSEFADLTPDEVNTIMDFEMQKMQAMLNPALAMGGGMPGAMPPGAMPAPPPATPPSGPTPY